MTHVDTSNGFDSVASSNLEFKTYAQGLLDLIDAKLKAPLSVEMQEEIGRLMHLLSDDNAPFVFRHRFHFDTAFGLLADEEPNMDLIRSIRLNLEVAEVREAGGLTGLIVRLCGPGPASAMLAGLLTIFLALCILMVLITLGHMVVTGPHGFVADLADVRTLLDKLKLYDIYILFFASFLGSIVSVVTRMAKLLTYTVQNPVEIYVAVLFRPLISLGFALFIYAVLKAGIISFLGLQLEGPRGMATVWVLGFLAGYSERFSKDFVAGAERKLGSSNSHPVN